MLDNCIAVPPVIPMPFLRVSLHAIAICTGLSAAVPVAAQQMDQLTLPARPAGAPTGSQFKDVILNLPREMREEAIYREVTTGNVPDFMRNLKPVTLTATIGGQPKTGTIYVTPEYLAVGSDVDYFRMPMTPILAQWIADATSTLLPTRKMVNATWTTAPCRLAPSPIPPSAAMVTVPVFWDHQVTVQSQRDAKPNPLGDLVGGHKKDVIITPRLHDPATPNRVAIYGWHQSSGVPIQPIYLGHGETYADYSHGIRLVNSRMLLDGEPVAVQDVLTSPGVSALLNDESLPFTAVAPPRYQAGSPPAQVKEWDAY